MKYWNVAENGSNWYGFWGEPTIEGKKTQYGIGFNNWIGNLDNKDAQEALEKSKFFKSGVIQVIKDGVPLPPVPSKVSTSEVIGTLIKVPGPWPVRAGRSGDRSQPR